MTRKYFEKYKSCQCEGKFITKMKTGRRINVDASGNTNMQAKNIMFAILLLGVAKMMNIL